MPNTASKRPFDEQPEIAELDFNSDTRPPCEWCGDPECPGHDYFDCPEASEQVDDRIPFDEEE